MEIPETTSSTATPQSGAQAITAKMPRYTYYLSNYEYLGPSGNHNFSVDDDKSHATSPKFGVDNALDEVVSNVDDCNTLSGSFSGVSVNQPSSQNVGGDPGKLINTFDNTTENSNPAPCFGKADSISRSSDRQDPAKFFTVDANDELGSASVAEECNSYYSESPMHFEEQRNMRAAVFVDQPLADRRQRWMTKYFSGNVEQFRKKQKAWMDELARRVTTGKELSEFPIKCVFAWGETGSDGKFDPLYIKEGDIIVDRFHVSAILGHTPFSVVVKALDQQNSEEVCVKISMPETVSQAIDEINLLKTLNAAKTQDNCAIVQLKDYFYFRGCIFTILELLGPNLYEATRDIYNKRVAAVTHSRTNGREQTAKHTDGWTLKAISKIARDILVSMKYLHGFGIINCDIKPENIVLNTRAESPFVKLIDFGSSCYIQERLSHYVQSRSYRAPEVIMGLPYDTQIDIWSLGCVLCEIYIQRILFPSDNNATLMASMISLLGVPPVYLLEHKMNSSFMVLPNGNVADLSVSTEMLKGRQKGVASDYQSSMRCNMSVSNSSVGSIITSHLGMKTDAYTNADYDSMMDINESQGDADALMADNTYITPRKYSIMQEGLVAQCDHSIHLKQGNKGIKIDFCDRRSNPKCVRIIEPSRCTIDEMLNTSASAELSTFGDFIKGLLQYDPLERLTAESALSHRFITENCSSD
ncbi:kinase domain containing protein protein [Babesia ovis]|uniref:Kinase domain containing protein protein n=1 Tax=Babesia ovis TaxID=5869 RepID=A0A9W5T9J1_BABOV|nr:kinase domain containing protein protein [Babesia ovis]